MTLLVPFTVAAAMLAAAPAAPAPLAALRLDNVRLLVGRFDETYVFYRDVLGLRPTWGKPGDNYASFEFAGGGQLALFRRQLMADAVGTRANPATRTEQDTAALVLSVDDVDAVCAQLTERGVRLIDSPRNQDAWGIRAAHFRDPDGNLIEVFSPLKKG